MKETKKLIKQAKLHDKDAFTQLMQLYMQDYYKTALAILMNDEDAADAIQEAILSCWENIHTLRNDRYFKTWMTRILINKCYAIYNRRSHEVILEEMIEQPIEDKSNYEFIELLSVLDEKYRIPMYLFYGQELKISEIANILGTPQSTIQTRLSRGRRQLADYYNNREDR